MEKTAFRVIPGKQLGTFRPQIGKRVFGLWWQWHDMQWPPESPNIGDAVLSIFCLVTAGDDWQRIANESIKP